MKKSNNALIILVLLIILPLSSYGQIQPYYGGVNVGSLMPEGVHLSAAYLSIGADQLNDASGDEISSMDIGMGPMSTEFDMGIQAAALFCTWVSKTKILGGTYSAFAVLPYAASFQSSLIATAPDGSSIPLFDNQESGFFDLVVSPIQLGWSKERWDLSAGLSLNCPIGSYDAGAANRWSLIPNIGGSYFFDTERTFSLSSKMSFELNAAQQKEDIDLAVGDEMIIEWGMGKMLIPFGRFGIIGYSVFQMNEDKGLGLTSSDLHSSHSIGGEYMMFLPPVKLGIVLRAVTCISAKDDAPTTRFMAGLSKSF